MRSMARQLRRPMRTESWFGRRALIGPRGVKAERIVFSETDTVLVERGKRWMRRHGAPDRVILDDVPSWLRPRSMQRGRRRHRVRNPDDDRHRPALNDR